MSVGSPIVQLRIPAELLDQIDQAIESGNKRRSDEPWDRSGWIRQAIKDKLDHIRRSKKKKGKGRGVEEPVEVG